MTLASQLSILIFLKILTLRKYMLIQGFKCNIKVYRIWKISNVCALIHSVDSSSIFTFEILLGLRADMMVV